MATELSRLYRLRGLDLTQLLRDKIESEYQRKEAATGQPVSRRQAKTQLHAQLEKHYFVLHYLYLSQRIFRLDESTPRAEVFVNLNYKLMARFIGDHYCDFVLSNLRTWGIIERDGEGGRGEWRRGVWVPGGLHREGGKSIGYRLASAYRGCFHERQRLPILNKRFEAKLARLTADLVEDALAGNEVETEVERLIKRNIEQVTVRYETAMAYCRQRLAHTYGTDDPDAIKAWLDAMNDPANPDPLARRWRKARSERARRLLVAFAHAPAHGIAISYTRFLEAARTKDPVIIAYLETIYTKDQFECDEFNLNELAGTDRRQVRDPKGRRVHNVLTSLSRPLRGFLYHRDFPDRELVSNDIAASQPTILAARVIREHGGRELLLADAEAYAAQCEAGSIYQHLQPLLGLAGQDYAAAKPKIKEAFYTVMFDLERFHNAAREQFAAAFPTVSRLVSRIKQLDAGKQPARGEAYKPHARLACELQREESTIMIDTVSSALGRASIFFFPIHDAIISFPQDAARVHREMEGAFWLSADLQPRIGRETFKQPVPPSFFQAPLDWEPVRRPAPLVPRPSRRQEAREQLLADLDWLE